MSASSRHHASPLPIKVGASYPDVVDHISKLTIKVNRMDEDLVNLSAQVLLSSGQVAALQEQGTTLIDQVNKLTDAVRELRETLLPGAAMRKELITLPNIIIEEVKHVLDEAELSKRRNESIRTKSLRDEDSFARNRDLRNAKFAFYGALVVMFLGELVRILLTHQL
jgi:hypothetical protein